MLTGDATARVLAGLLIILVFPDASESADDMGLDDYLQQIRINHPFFTQQALNSDIEREQHKRFLGDEDWVAKASTQFDHAQRSAGNPFVAEETETFSVSAGMERTFWANGSRLSVDYDYSHSDQKYAPPAGSFDEHGNGINLTWSVPLLKNRGGELSRLDYDLQGYIVDIAGTNSIESQENFLEQQGLLFLDWVLVDEQRRIADNRLKLAEKELTRTRKKRRSRLAARVDVLRARDEVSRARQNLGATESQWLALQAELATNSACPQPDRMQPDFDLYRLQEVPPPAAALQDLLDNARPLVAIDLQLSRLERLASGLDNELKPELDLVLGGGLGSEDDELSGSAKFDQPQYRVGVNYRYPLGQRAAKADVSRVRLQQQQLRAERASVIRQLESQLRNVLVQLRELEEVIDLNREQIDIAQQRTSEELKRHNQGLSELSFVIQSRDNEQSARLSYAANAAAYQKLWLRYRSIRDDLLPDSGVLSGSAR